MVALFLAGDVMTGRGIDQILPHPSDPVLYESYVRDARTYVGLAEQVNGPVTRPVDFAYIWGEALGVLDRFAPDARIVNLETSVTRSDRYWPGKGINYRMHPDNTPCLTAAKLDCCVLANNHVLDWGYAGLAETLETLHAAGVGTTGAGRNAAEALAPAVIEREGRQGRVLVFGAASRSSGVPAIWAAQDTRAGVSLLPDLSAGTAAAVTEMIDAFRRPDDVVVVSIHWGGNWGYSIPREQREFARALVASGAVDVVHGHSSHHAKGIEIYDGKPIIYGCGDFLNDYEGISGHDEYCDDLPLAYFVRLDEQRRLADFEIVPLRIERLSLHAASRADVEWVRETLDRESSKLGARVTADSPAVLRVAPASSAER